MDITSLITIVVAGIAIYFFIRFIVSPLIKAIVGIVAFVIIIYALQYFFKFNLNQLFGPFAPYLDKVNWILQPLNYFLEKLMVIFRFLWDNVPK